MHTMKPLRVDQPKSPCKPSSVMVLSMKRPIYIKSVTEKWIFIRFALLTEVVFCRGFTVSESPTGIVFTSCFLFPFFSLRRYWDINSKLINLWAWFSRRIQRLRSFKTSSLIGRLNVKIMWVNLGSGRFYRQKMKDIEKMVVDLRQTVHKSTIRRWNPVFPHGICRKALKSTEGGGGRNGALGCRDI